MIQARSADGVIHQFPDGTDPSVVDGAMKRYASENKPSLMRDVTGFMANVNRGLAVGDEMAAGARTIGNILGGKVALPGTMTTSDLISGKRGVVDDFKHSMAVQRGTEDAYTAAHPHTAALARGTGMAATAAIPGGRFAQLPMASRAVNMARGATTAALVGAGNAAADRGTGSERVGAAARAAIDPLTLALGAGAGALAPAMRRAPRAPNADVVRARELGIPLTPGMAGGGVGRSVENALTSAPLLGPRIAAAQTRSVEGFNRVPLQQALAVVGQELPANVATGHAAIQHTRQALNRVYQDLRPVGGVQQDAEMVQDVTTALQNVMPTLGDTMQHRLMNIVDQKLSQPLAARGGFMDADAFQDIERNLDHQISRHQRSADPDHNDIGDALDGIRQAVRNAAARQNPEYAEGKRAADLAWATFATARDAAKSNRALADGIYTPNEFLGAVKRGDDSVGAVSEGEGLGQDLGAMAQRLLPNKMPNSGTAERGMLGGGLSALGFQALHDPAGAAITGGAYLGASTLASAPYSQAGQALFNRVLDGRIASNERRAALVQLQNLANQSPEARALFEDVMRRLPGAAGVAGRAAQPELSASNR